MQLSNILFMKENSNNIYFFYQQLHAHNNKKGRVAFGLWISVSFRVIFGNWDWAINGTLGYIRDSIWNDSWSGFQPRPSILLRSGFRLELDFG
jgi:hypothetical protein